MLQNTELNVEKSKKGIFPLSIAQKVGLHQRAKALDIGYEALNVVRNGFSYVVYESYYVLLLQNTELNVEKFKKGIFPLSMAQKVGLHQRAKALYRGYEPLCVVRNGFSYVVCESYMFYCYRTLSLRKVCMYGSGIQSCLLDLVIS